MPEKTPSSRRKALSSPGERTWWKVLLAIRQASLGGTRPFTVQDVANAVQMQGTERSTKEDMASAWVGKFVRWGYVRHEGKADGPVRKIRTFQITKYGLERKEPGPTPEWKAEE